MFGPDGSYDEAVLREDVESAPLAQPHEIAEAILWERELNSHARRLAVPLMFSLGEHDALWQADDDILELARATFAGVPAGVFSIVKNAGHCIHLHRVAGAHCLRTLAFAEEAVAFC